MDDNRAVRNPVPTRNPASVLVDVNESTPRAPREWPRFMTARVAADYCDTSPWTIRRHVRPYGRRGRSFVYAIEDVERWMCGTALGVDSASSGSSSTRRSGPPSAKSISTIRELGRSRNRDAASGLDVNRADVAA